MTLTQATLNWTDERRARQASIADKVLAALKAGPKSRTELEAYGPRVAAYVHQLKTQGHAIGAEWHGGEYVYAYEGRLNAEVLDEWKAAYYASAHWNSVRRDRLAFDDFACTRCGASDVELHVHHWIYDLFAEQRDDLQTFCEACHEWLHENPGVRVHFPHFVSPAIAERLMEVT